MTGTCSMRDYGMMQSKARHVLDKIVLAVAICAPLVTIPQIYKLYRYRSAAGISTLSWYLYIVCAIPWLLYGIVHRDRRIITSTTLWLVFDIWVVVLATMYR